MTFEHEKVQALGEPLKANSKDHDKLAMSAKSND